MKIRKTRVLLAPVLVLAVGLGAGACSVEVPVDDPTTSGSTSPKDSSPSTDTDTRALPSTSTASGPNSRGNYPENDPPTDYRLPQNIKLGACYLRKPDAYDLYDAIEIDCTEPHYMEIVSTYTWPEAYKDFIHDEYGNQKTRCWDVVKKMLHDGGFNDSGIYGFDHWMPSAMQLASNERMGYCTVYGSESDLLVGSLVAGTFKGSERAPQ